MLLPKKYSTILEWGQAPPPCPNIPAKLYLSPPIPLFVSVVQNVKTQLEVTSKKLKQSKEEGDMIRADLKKMIKQYQVL